MSWIEDTQKALQYIEDNLNNCINAEEAANHIGYTSKYFQKMFSVVTGITVGEYIRNRKLTLAGQELLAQKSKVVDIALKYGYETPESFRKAFIRFHGFTPKKVRSSKNRLRYFNPLKIEISITGGFDMSRRVLTEGENAFEIAESFYIERYCGRENYYVIVDPRAEEIENEIDKQGAPPDNIAIMMSKKLIDSCAYMQTATEKNNDGTMGFRHIVEAQFVYFDKGKADTLPKQRQYRMYTSDAKDVKNLLTAFAHGIAPDVSDWEDITEIVIPKRR